jgi:protein-L-isoaspartate(D-aspartate) O-methyltransferase
VSASRGHEVARGRFADRGAPDMTNADYSQQRVKMVDGQIRTVDVTDLSVLQAFLDVPRDAFVPDQRRALAYIDTDILVAGDGGRDSRYLMRPALLAKLIQEAAIGRNDVVLDVGAGTGYASAILSRLASSVIALGYDNVAVVQGPLSGGYPSEAPYDVIFVGGSVDLVPEALVAQLKDGGRLVAVEGHGNAGVAKVFVRSGGVVAGRRAFNAAVKPLPGFERVEAFEF